MEGTFHLSNLLAKAYDRVQGSEHSGDLKKFEDYLQKQPSLTQQSWAESASQDGGRLETKLIDIYEKVYLYQIRFVLQYGQGKWRRNMGGILKPEDWKEKWKAIDTVR